MKRLLHRSSHCVLTGFAASLAILTIQGCLSSSIPDSSFLRNQPDPIQVGSREPPLFVATPIVHVGAASWYGPGFSGKKTASGEIFDETKLTAAHKTMPLGKRARVTHMGNGKSIEVVINDRGPYVNGRMIDLSQAAAKALGMIDNGVAKVQLELLQEVVVTENDQGSTITERVDMTR